MAWRYRKGSEMGRIIGDDGSGIYPCHRGEYCGNHGVDPRYWISTLHEHRTLQERIDELVGDKYFLYPRATPTFTMEQLVERGCMGLYSRGNNLRSGDDIEFVPTPPDLMIPGLEHLYNLDGVFGLGKHKIPNEMLMPISDPLLLAAMSRVRWDKMVPMGSDCQ